ncbi:MAG: hypothetical protein AVDCRST_MAG34-3031 [uncultured Nocardioidaceae bacterium]|uniref:Mycothiol-dependent maleylpyruvate isomerase metal-binding domain-containing protein n=1 Tax=uncultured Nocardioidaceae bacterium TaxID=253824 RepID=A0A6J4MRI5_9ACTN|nr:MAG: hypothetical protein AVDCRST_MAG34-3031 [uncultured Nocardioidaceae bacterium]
MTEGQDRLRSLVDTWHRTASEVVVLLRSLRAEEWALPTDLPGWDVRAVACHLAHLESELAGNPQQPVAVPAAPHIRGWMGQFTEAGPLARGSWSTAQIIEELETSVRARFTALATAPPPDLAAPAPGFAATAGWSWDTLLANRCVDMWMHEQDIRRATGRPGGFDGPGAAHTVDTFLRALPFVLGKKVGAPPGTSVHLQLTGDQPRTVAVGVGPDRRGKLLDGPPHEPSVRMVLDTHAWIALAGGRRAPGDDVRVLVRGDESLGRRLLQELAVTP